MKLSHPFISKSGLRHPPAGQAMKSSFLVFTLCCTHIFAQQAEPEAKVVVRASVELNDGSRLIGTPLGKSLLITLDFMNVSIPVERVRQCDINHKDGSALVSLQNGDRFSGFLNLEKFQMETVLGELSPEIRQIDRMTFSTIHEGNMPAGQGTILFGGVNWQGWRTGFQIQGDKLASLPKARDGFNYGHSGGGRGPGLVTNVGNPDWRDYRVEVDYCVPGVDAAFNPYALGKDFRDGEILFHLADAKESWNECGNSSYGLALHGDGSWQLSCSYNDYCNVPVGYGAPHTDGRRELASGSGLKLDRANGNHYRIDIGGQHIQVWVDGRQIIDVIDNRMGEIVGGQTLDHGGVGFQGGFDAMEWIKNFSATSLLRSD